MASLISQRTVPFWTRRQLDIIRISALRQLKVRYRGTMLGILWSFAYPLLMTGLYTTLFGTAFASYYDGSVPRYVASAFLGVVVVTFFSQATAEMLASVVANGGLLNKIAIDPESFPLAALAANVFQQAVTSFLLIMLLAAFITRDPVHIILVPCVMLAIVALVAGIGLILATLFVFARDIQHMWGVLSFVLWMTSPVFYPAALVPAKVRLWFDLNPVGLAIGSLRDVAINRGPIDVRLVGSLFVVAAAFALIGHAAFRLRSRKFMDLL